MPRIHDPSAAAAAADPCLGPSAQGNYFCLVFLRVFASRRRVSMARAWRFCTACWIISIDPSIPPLHWLRSYGVLRCGAANRVSLAQ